MPDSAAPDTNAAIWKSDTAIQHWLAGMDERERKRAEQFAFMAELLPFDPDASLPCWTWARGPARRRGPS